MNQTPAPAAHHPGSDLLRVGYVPLCDCAPLVVAAEWGLFHRHGLHVRLVREVGWATVRDKVVHGQLNAAHALAAMPFAATLGLGSVPRASLTGLVLNLQGNAVSLAMHYWNAGARDAKTFGNLVRRERPQNPLVFGVVSLVSSHRMLMERWLTEAGLVAGRDYHLAVLPPPQLADVIRAGHIAGFCVGDPWNSVAIECGLAWCAATSADLAPRHVEKVLMVTDDFTRERPEQHLRLIAAVLEACQLCADATHHEEISRLLARREYVNAPAALILRSFSGAFHNLRGVAAEDRPFTIYHDADSNVPTAERGEWTLRHLLPGHSSSEPSCVPALARRVFREDLFEAALQLRCGVPRSENHKLEPDYV